MIGRLAGALVRAILVALTIVTPAILLPGTTVDQGQVVILLAFLAAVFTFVEYFVSAPSLVEFRDAPPFNRLRFAALFLILFGLAMFLRGKTDPTTLTRLFTSLGLIVGNWMDFPYSPVRLMLLALPDDAPLRAFSDLRVAAGASYAISIGTLAIFFLYLRTVGWPVPHGGFNIWVNLPTFDPTAGGDVVERLRSDARFNLILGFLLPFLIAAAVRLFASVFDPLSLAEPHTLIWTMTAWAFLPASMLMRGVALSRVAALITEQRIRAAARHGEGGLASASA